MAKERTGIAVSSMFNQQTPTIGKLHDRIEELEAEIASLRQNNQTGANDEALQQKIDELTARLAEDGGTHRISINVIKPDPNQPRTVFPPHVIRARAKSLRDKGQLSPVILTPLEDGTFLIFDGELRWRSAPEASYSELEAVFRRSSTQETAIDRFDQQLTTSLEAEKPHPLDLANGLVRLIIHECPTLSDRVSEIPGLLNAAIQRFKRTGKIQELDMLRYAALLDQKAWLEQNDFRSIEERAVFAVILSKSLNPVSINSNVFPLIGLAEDLQNAVRTWGIEASKILVVKKLTAETLSTDEMVAIEVRQQVIQQIVKQNLPLNAVKRLVQEKLLKRDQSTTPAPTKAVEKIQKQLDAIEVDQLSESDLKQIQKSLKAQLKNVTDRLKSLESKSA
ncbi:ParB/RepB/Spo0J family partition protein [Leptolyngbya sp. AN03gr2]|uniref:ParB/RepB/Spo0J family partition protein n=1 Tax=unclassified Leptolyngbya TaxID=2650499 RepID=UPI003D3162A2